MLLILRRATAKKAWLPIVSPHFRFFSNLAPISFDFRESISVQTLTKSELESLVHAQYNQGKYHNLVLNVVASPSVLLSACHRLCRPESTDSPTSDWISTHFFSLSEMSAQITENRFDIESSCITMHSSSRKGESLVLPNLRLKVLIEAIRMVLEIVYDNRFATFSYGGRVGMGRHTAIRYLKNSVEDPNWWFNVSFDRRTFKDNHVDKLCSIIQQRIKDGILFDVLRRLFKAEVLKIELGGCYLGRGFPQECGLSSILINIYFDLFDKLIHEVRLDASNSNPKLDQSEANVWSDNLFFKPLKIYAVRYLDEILVITSGTKMLTMDLKNMVTKFLEIDLELKVDTVKTAIHSAITEKIDFIGMELQAVPPSVLRPPMSEKAIRARKKYLRQKEVKALELRNARERNRKKLGMKIFSHVFKKLKKSSNGFKIDFPIENEVSEIFKKWADEVVRDFLENLKEEDEENERENWHRQLTGGDFLHLKHIRDKLPTELVDSYDKFQTQVDKYLDPTKAMKVLENERKRVEEEEEQVYANRTIEDLTKLCMKVSAPMELLKKSVKLVGFTNHMGRPRPISSLVVLEDVDIIKWFEGIGRRWLDYFRCCHNFRTVKTIVSYHLRFSCILTLAEKHEATKNETIRHFTKDLMIDDVFHFPSEREIKMMGAGNLSDPKPVDGTITLRAVRLAYEPSSSGCAAHFCERTDIGLYRLWLLQKELNLNPWDESKWVKGMGVIHESLNQKCLPLCCQHKSLLYKGLFTLQDVDFTALVVVE
ncbi:nuclear intron maturase 3, mitochondrial [Impatiens glandulifera]|uniref:nuclear intron maturase 3, mitochondrial n=1 Tax=Impatiens glandulifera TaxID=253017 RepID=UPI001FB0507D|nr:nuclear intron maturase 3, mitochondrial [Impatiens glandulifera]